MPAGRPAYVADTWHGRMMTTDADFARFSEIDVDEATTRLRRLAACYLAVLYDRDAAILDARPGEALWTLRQVVHHGSNVTAYADMVGRVGTSA